MNNTYQQIKTDLTSKEKFHIKLGLERVSEILELLGNPQDKFKTIHVAGTNGKGSTSAMLAKVLQESHYQVGLFTSPHLVKYNERIKISSKDIPDEDLANLLERVNTLAKYHEIPLTEFEVLTVVAFLYFAEQKIDIAIIEVGLGGRLDATNVINPILEIITSISLDHTDRLGDTIEKIAYEKAGIIKKNSTVITNQNNAGLSTIKEVAKTQNASLKIAPNATSAELKNGINEITIQGKVHKIGLIGEFQGENLSLVLEAIEFLKENRLKINNSEKALLETTWRARMQFLEPNVILDGAHNPAAAKYLRETLDKNFANIPRVWFFGALKNKDYAANVKILFGKEDFVYFVKLNLQNTCGNAELEQFCGIPNREIIDISNLLEILNREKNNEKLVIICGSLYLAGEVLALLGG